MVWLVFQRDIDHNIPYFQHGIRLLQCIVIIINFEEDSEKKSESQMGFEPTTLRDLVGCSNHLSYWRLYGEQGPICGSRLEPHHAATQPSNDWHTRTH